MNAPRRDWTIGYRSKGPDGTKSTCALMFNAFIREQMPKSERYSFEFAPGVPTNMIIAPHQAGFKMNFKHFNAATGELNVSWAQLERAPADESGKGRLSCWLGEGGLWVNVSMWKVLEADQPTLFVPNGRIIIPHDAVGTGGMRNTLFDD